MRLHTLAFLAAFIGLVSLPAFAQTGRLTVDLQNPGAKISPMLYGLMTEEINHSYDGGLYAELIQNRIFQDNAEKPTHWSVVASAGADGKIALDDQDPVNTDALKKSLRLDIAAVGPEQRVGVATKGYWGIPVLANTPYHFSVYARSSDNFSGPLTVSIESSDGGKTYAQATVSPLGTQWKKYEAVLQTGDVQPSTDSRLVISASSKGSVWLSLVSLFRPTFNNRPNGNRIDLMQMLADLHPAFLRLPGGNYLEGNTIAERFAWEKTIGPIEQRPGHRGPWGYRSSDGLGLLEFLDWCEDLKMEPLLAVFAGYSLRGEHVGAGPQLQPFVQEALDEIEYATGDSSTKWGKQRAQDGHEAPFKIEYVEIGNEDLFDRSRSYDGRFTQFYDAIKAKYPNLKVIATTPVHSRVPDVVDDHYYRSAREMERDVNHYDKTDRSGPKIFVGEWATTEGRPTPNMNAALGDAAWLTGLERNSDIVVMSCYAPLLVNVNPNASQWGTNLIGYDALNSFGSPSYHAQKMFSENRGDTVLPVAIVEAPREEPPPPPPSGGIGVGTWETSAQFKDIQVTQDGKVLLQSDFAKGTEGWRPRGGAWKVDDGALTQTSPLQDVRNTAGNAVWANYTYSLKARKLSGNEGFLVMFHARGRNDFVWWNVGGWGDTRSGLQQVMDGAKTDLGASAPVTIEANRWYDIRIELNGRDIKCYLDDKLITEATETPGISPPAIYATASRVDATGAIILKVVNTGPTAQPMQVDLKGASRVEKNASVVVLSGQPTDQNSIKEPRKVFPKQADIDDAAPTFAHEFPGYSVSVLKIAAIP